MDKEKLIARYRNINVDTDWWDVVYDNFIEYCLDKGIHVEAKEISFSGFWSQGDGATFSGFVNTKGIHKLVDMKYYPMTAKLIEEGGSVSFVWTPSGHGYNFPTIGPKMDSFEAVIGDDHPLVEVWDQALDGEYEMLHEFVQEEVNELCSYLYGKLREEYEYLISDEVVWESIETNGLADDGTKSQKRDYVPQL
jgi:hypothetical protein